MHFPAIAAIFFTVVLLVSTAYFLMGGLPLLTLQHDSPVDQRFVKRFFDLSYKASRVAACGATISYALWGRYPFAAGTAAIAVIALAMRRKVLPVMDQLSIKIQSNDAIAIQQFRRAHVSALLLNLGQLVALVWGVAQITL